MSQASEGLPTTDTEAVQTTALPSPWTLQLRVLKAIVLRNISAEYGDSRLGYLLGILFPIAMGAFLYFIFGLRGRIAPADFPLPVFLLTGYIAFMSFRQVYGNVSAAASKADSLLAFPQITQLDLVFAALIKEAATETVAFVILMVFSTLISHVPPANLFAVLLLFWALLWIGFGVGLILCALQRIVPNAIQFINMGLRLLMWVSGVVFTVDRLPPAFWPYLKWNPILHAIEGLRQSWVTTYNAPIYSPVFIIGAGFVLTMLGLSLERVTRRFVG
jgi:capsular polysaccharide transport system permease protein